MDLYKTGASLYDSNRFAPVVFHFYRVSCNSLGFYFACSRARVTVVISQTSAGP